MFQYLQDIVEYRVSGTAPHNNHQPAALELPHTAPKLQRQIYPSSDFFFIHLCVKFVTRNTGYG
jgi:hypothetical protein